MIRAIDLLAQVPTLSATLSTEDRIKNSVVNFVVLSIGVIIGVFVVYLARKLILRIPQKRPTLVIFVIDGAIVTGTTIVVSIGELWRIATITSMSPWGAAAYFMGGGAIASGIGVKWLMATVNERTKADFDRLSERLRESEMKCNRHVQAEILVGQVMRAKAERLLARSQNGVSFELAIAPRKQIEILTAVLHRQLSKDLTADQRIRIGIYRLAPDGHLLRVFCGWDGQRSDCFSDSHTQFMNVSQTPKDDCVVVECWRMQDDDPTNRMILVENFETDNRFGYFHKAQSRTLKSMVAYNHLSQFWNEGRFVLTADSTQPGFFSGDMAQECKVLFPAISRRVEMELAALQNN